MLQLSVDLSCEAAVVIGHGNVAIDVCRILLTPVDILRVSILKINICWFVRSFIYFTYLLTDLPIYFQCIQEYLFSDCIVM